MLSPPASQKVLFRCLYNITLLLSRKLRFIAVHDRPQNASRGAQTAVFDHECLTSLGLS